MSLLMLLRDHLTGKGDSSVLSPCFALKQGTAFTHAFVILVVIDSGVVLCSYAIKKKDEIERVAKANR